MSSIRYSALGGMHVQNRLHIASLVTVDLLTDATSTTAVSAGGGCNAKPNPNVNGCPHALPGARLSGNVMYVAADPEQHPPVVLTSDTLFPQRER